MNKNKNFKEVNLCVIVFAVILLRSVVVESSKSINFLYKNLNDNHNWISNYNDDLIAVTEMYHIKDEATDDDVDDDVDVDVDVDDVPGPTSSMPSETTTAAFSHYNRWPLWLTNQRPLRQQLKAATVKPAVSPIESHSLSSSVTYHFSHFAVAAAAAAAWSTITKFNNESFKSNKLKAADTVKDKIMFAGNGSREVGALQLINEDDNIKAFHASDIEAPETTSGEDNKWQQQKLQKPQTTNRKQQRNLKFYTPNALKPLAFGQLPQFRQQAENNKQHQQLPLPLPTTLDQMHLDYEHQQNSEQQQKHRHHHHYHPTPPSTAGYRSFYNAELNTKFFLYTLTKPQEQMLSSHFTDSVKTSSEENVTNTPPINCSTHGRVLDVVTYTINTAFGVNTHPVASTPGIQAEELNLYDAGSLRQSRFNPFNPTRILIHGWLGDSSAGMYNTLVPEFLKLQNGTYNVICVDWGKGAIADYITASYRVKPVGKVLAKFIDFLHRESAIDLENIHVIGFSMGAHVAGIAGKYMQNGHLSVIYALDPALPLFRYDNIKERIDKSDADYVEVMHTSVGTYGYDRPLGHVDFYVNYGSSQPGCYLHECSHIRAFQIFAQSLKHTNLHIGIECKGELWQDMIRTNRCKDETGKYLHINAEGLGKIKRQTRRGIYYVLTYT